MPQMILFTINRAIFVKFVVKIQKNDFNEEIAILRILINFVLPFT